MIKIVAVLVYFITIPIILSIKVITTDEHKILFLNDIHLDVLYNSESVNKGNILIRCKNSTDYMNNHLNRYDYSRYNCETNVVLLDTVMKDIKSKFSELDLIILGGDVIAHGIYKLDLSETKEENRNLFKKTFTIVVNKIREYFPKVRLIPILGNNDLYEHYQTPDEKSKRTQFDYLISLFFCPNGTEFGYNFNENNFNKNFIETIRKGFYYSFYDPILQVNFIALNSNMFSFKNLNITGEEVNDQLEFLEKELNKLESKNSKTFVVMHIPPFPFYYENQISFQYKEEYTSRIEEIAKRYNKSIINFLSAHIHWAKMGVRKVNKLEKNSFLKKNNRIDYLSVINFHSLSPIYTNNPGYSIIFYDKTENRIINIEAHLADLIKTLDKNRNYEFSLNKQISPNKLFKNIFNYKKDFSFTTFDNSDFADFIYQRINKPKTFNTLLRFISGKSNDDSILSDEEYKSFLLKYGYTDPQYGYKYFKCSFKVLYEKEISNCINDEI